MGWLHDGHRSLIERARAENATVVVSIFVNPRQFGETTDFTRYPRNEARDLAICEAAGVDFVFAPDRRGGLSAWLRHGRLGRGHRRTAGRSRAARALRRCRDGRGDPVRAGRRRAGLLRDQGRPAGPGDPPDGARSRAADRSGPLPHRARPRRPGDVVAQCPAVAGRPRRGVGRAPRAARRPCGWEAGERSADALRATMRAVLAGEPLADVEYVSVADDLTLAELETVDGPALLSIGRPVRGRPPHRQRTPALTPREPRSPRRCSRVDRRRCIHPR